MWVLIDNYDSFTYILHHYLLKTGNECRVIKNDELSTSQLIELDPERIIISPGPGIPQKAGITMDVLNHFYNKVPVLGICLGHQAIGVHFGASLIHAPYPMHGKVATIEHAQHPLFSCIPSITEVMRYHSLVINPDAEGELSTIAYSVDEHLCMAVAHHTFPLLGLQFHPESVGTSYGQQMIDNWAGMYR